MSGHLKISLGQYSDKGRKESNQDFHGACIPEEPQLSGKGIAIALADGISSSNVSQVASQSAVRVFLEDYYCTSPAWSVKKSAQTSADGDQLLAVRADATEPVSLREGSRLRVHDERAGAQVHHRASVSCRRCAHLPAARRRARAAHPRSPRAGSRASRATSAARSASSRTSTSTTSRCASSRAMSSCSPPTACTNSPTRASMINAVKDHGGDLDAAAQLIAREAFDRGSDDNLTTLVVRVDALPDAERQRSSPAAHRAAVPAGARGAHELRRLHHPARAACQQPQPRLPRELRGVAGAGGHQDAVDRDCAPTSRSSNDSSWKTGWRSASAIAHVLKAAARGRRRNFLYTVTEFVDGQTLHQWLIDNPKPPVETVRGSIEQIANGLHGVSPAGDAAPGPAAAERHDRRQRHGEDHRFRLDARGGNFGDRFAARRAANCWARCSTPRRNISSARAARRVRICFRWESSPTRCCRAGCHSAPRFRRRARAPRSAS